MEHRKFTEEFKRNAVMQATAPGASTSSVARGVGVSHNLLHRWIRKMHGDTNFQKMPGTRIMKKPLAVLPDLIAQNAENVQLEMAREALQEARHENEVSQNMAAAETPSLQEPKPSYAKPMAGAVKRMGRPRGSKNKRTLSEQIGAQAQLNLGDVSTSNAPKKMGRPKGSVNKATLAAAVTAPKKMGRPKSSVNKATLPAAATAPKKMGRPKGSVNKPKIDAVQIDAPKKMGRPKGSVNKATLAAAVTAPKKMGRPKGSVNKATLAAAVNAPKKMGRPKGSVNKATLAAAVNAPKKMGRPKGSVNKATLPAAATAPKKMGRPKGSVNKPTIVAAKRRGRPAAGKPGQQSMVAANRDAAKKSASGSGSPVAGKMATPRSRKMVSTRTSGAGLVDVLQLRSQVKVAKGERDLLRKLLKHFAQSKMSQ